MVKLSTIENILKTNKDLHDFYIFYLSTIKFLSLNDLYLSTTSFAYPLT